MKFTVLKSWQSKLRKKRDKFKKRFNKKSRNKRSGKKRPRQEK